MELREAGFFVVKTGFARMLCFQRSTSSGKKKHLFLASLQLSRFSGNTLNQIITVSPSNEVLTVDTTNDGPLEG